ncbi:Ligand-binding in the NO signaling and Golgi transport [Glarea lozoyensis ATCC 20868]|uniref:Ligand-binding in the NO signaling and Golgi transport n=1 Tax=Glarea lozoyensis (strain ATCC 20868 / MF5171) TaxID=1116229 RepID=S3DRF5_GLAL2|nr:Ligand-binding in the NO signaling and Golgi transport [Glarea lozoyensis ATCC 20868]EPE34591.1 Ligand-binding in the NO signaling and Golgi transport [Glarea lozoyensis ATCC 20868]
MSFESPLPPYNASDPSAQFLNSSCLDLLMIELVPLAWRVVRDVDLKDTTTTSTAGNSVAGGNVGGSAKGGSISGGGAGGNSIGGNEGTKGEEEEQEERDAVFYRLEMLGYRVGQGMVERFSKDRPRFTDTLDVIKFLCKDLWMLVFRKQIDNLKTNHRGVYVLTDNSFRPFSRMSTEAGGQAVVRAQPFLWFPCGIIRGALASMGINATVGAETSELPGATFQIKSLSTKA